MKRFPRLKREIQEELQKSKIDEIKNDGQIGVQGSNRSRHYL